MARHVNVAAAPSLISSRVASVPARRGEEQALTLKDLKLADLTSGYTNADRGSKIQGKAYGGGRWGNGGGTLGECLALASSGSYNATVGPDRPRRHSLYAEGHRIDSGSHPYTHTQAGFSARMPVITLTHLTRHYYSLDFVELTNTKRSQRSQRSRRRPYHLFWRVVTTSRKNLPTKPSGLSLWFVVAAFMSHAYFWLRQRRVLDNAAARASTPSWTIYVTTQAAHSGSLAVPEEHSRLQTGGFDVYAALNKQSGASRKDSYSRTQSHVVVTGPFTPRSNDGERTVAKATGFFHRPQSSRGVSVSNRSSAAENSWAFLAVRRSFSEMTELADELREYGERTDGMATSSCYASGGQTYRTYDEIVARNNSGTAAVPCPSTVMGLIMTHGCFDRAGYLMGWLSQHRPLWSSKNADSIFGLSASYAVTEAND
ncbi:hypothetical protein BC629DRAFT_1444141 [Irpex lacteus]|nr:hypothetical protein BC629DRAFT_1444141 [Irpex lacteus]